MKRAFTLIEVLVTIGIISVLAGITLPVLVGSKKSAHRTDDMSKLRQLGVAGAMYADAYGDYPLSTSQLVNTKMVPVELCASKRDATTEGIANELAKFNQRRYAGSAELNVAPYKNSFVGLGEFGLAPEVMRDYVLTGPAAGWLIDASESEKTEWPTPTQWKGTYRRLTVDGAVIVRPYQDYQCYNGGKREACRMSVLLYVDPNPYFEELQKSDDQQFSSRRP